MASLQGTTPHAATHAIVGTDDLYTDGGHNLAAMNSIPAWAEALSSITLSITATGIEAFGFMTGKATKSVSTFYYNLIQAATNSPTMGVGLYVVTIGSDPDPNATGAVGTMTLVAQSSGAASEFTQALGDAHCGIAKDGSGNAIASYQIYRGQRYAVGFLQVNGSVAAKIGCSNVVGGNAAGLADTGSHRCMCGQLSGLTALSTSTTVGGLSGNGQLPYAAMK